MKLKHIQLFEEIMSKKRSDNYWYRGVYNLKNDEDGLKIHKSRFSPEPSIWFANNIEWAGKFVSMETDPIIFVVKLDENLNLWNPFNDSDYNYVAGRASATEIDLELLNRKNFILNNEWQNSNRRISAELQPLIKKLGYDGIWQQDLFGYKQTNITIQLFYEKFTFVKKIKDEEIYATLLKAQGFVPPHFNLLSIKRDNEDFTFNKYSLQRKADKWGLDWYGLRPILYELYPHGMLRELYLYFLSHDGEIDNLTWPKLLKILNLQEITFKGQTK